MAFIKPKQNGNQNTWGLSLKPNDGERSLRFQVPHDPYQPNNVAVKCIENICILNFQLSLWRTCQNFRWDSALELQTRTRLRSQLILRCFKIIRQKKQNKKQKKHHISGHQADHFQEQAQVCCFRWGQEID
jgi:hypothetical protein